MKESIKVSIIIPCFNGFRHIHHCLSSLCKQTYKNFEVIVVDDCSTDDSFVQLKELKTNLNLKIIKNEENRGPGFSRKIGISYACGDYICFCDTDDWYEDDFIEIMLENAIQNKSDLVFCDCYYVYEKSKVDTKWYEAISDINSKKEIIAYSYGSLCLTMIRQEILQGIEFPELYHGEDAALIPVIVSRSNNVFVVQKPLYNYLMRKDSASNQFDRVAFDSSKEVFNYISDSVGEEYKNEIEFLGIKGILYSGCLNAIKCKLNKSELYEAVDDFKKSYPSYKNNVYLKRLSKIKKIFILLMDHNCFRLAKLYAKFHTKYINR